MELDEIIEKIQKIEIQSASEVAKQGLRALSHDLKKSKKKEVEKFLEELNSQADRLAQTRITEPALRNGLRLVRENASCADSVKECQEILDKTVNNYIEKMERAQKKIWEIGEKRVKNGDTIMTHCHSHSVIGILRKAWENKKEFKVICTETRPRFQGRTTAEELLKIGIPTTLIIDSAARWVVNDVDLVMFGADAVTSDGYLVNKIGTSLIALAAEEARTSTCTACETFKFDPDTLAGDWEPIEKRKPREVWEKPPEKLEILNPAFDLTPPDLINFLICEEGVINIQEASRIMKEKWG